jgi:hypothetical protein
MFCANRVADADLPLPARGERVWARGPLRWDVPHGQNLQRHCGNFSAQNRGQAPSPSVAPLHRPLLAPRGEVKRHHAGKQRSFSRRIHAPELCPRQRRHFQRQACSRQRREQSAERRMPIIPRRPRGLAACRYGRGSAPIRGAPAFRRSAAALARANASAVGSAPVPAFPET